MSADKNDRLDNKPDYSMLPKAFLDQVAYVMMAGAIKYGRWNYTKGHDLTRLTSAATRHLKAIEAGEDLDPDTSERLGVDISHWACVAANALMALHQAQLGTLRDDRFSAQQPVDQKPAAELVRKWMQDDCNCLRCEDARRREMDRVQLGIQEERITISSADPICPPHLATEFVRVMKELQDQEKAQKEVDSEIEYTEYDDVPPICLGGCR